MMAPVYTIYALITRRNATQQSMQLSATQTIHITQATNKETQQQQQQQADRNYIYLAPETFNVGPQLLHISAVENLKSRLT